MILVTYIDGGPETSLRAYLEQHSQSCSVKIKKEHQRAWEDGLSQLLGEAVKYPDMRKQSDPIPTHLGTDELADYVDDCKDEEHVKPYYEDLRYMCQEDPCGMGYVFVMGRFA